jgi:hypothetical protein
MITSSFDTKSGTISLQIDTTASVGAQILSVGSLSYDYDQTPDSVSIDRVQALYSQLPISIMQYGDLGEDLWDILVSEATISDIEVNVSLTTWERIVYEFPMRLRLADISLDERSRTISLRLIPNVNLTATVADVFTAIATPKKVNFARKYGAPINQSKTYVQKATGVLDWIDSALNIVFGNNFSNDIKPSKTNGEPSVTEYIYDSVDNTSVGTRSLLMLNLGLDDVTPDEGDYIKVPANGLISFTEIPSGLLPSVNGSYNITISITGASFLGQIQFGDKIVLKSGIGYKGDIFGIQTIGTSTLTIVTDDPVIYFDEPWEILRPSAPNVAPAVGVLKDLAGIEGSVFGTGFSKNFYFNRLDRTSGSTVTINYDMVTDFKPTPFYLSLGSSIVAQRADGSRGIGSDRYGSMRFGANDTRVPNLVDYTSVALGNANASKELKIELAPGYPFLNKGKIAIGGWEGDYTTGSAGSGLGPQLDTQLEAILTANGIRSYFQALNNTEGGISIEFTVMGAVSMLPWETIQFDTRAPEKYRDRQFRPTSIKYNFVNDTVTIKAYQIDDITTPVYSDPYVRTGLNFKSGGTLLGKTFEIATNRQIAEGLRKVATFTLSAQASGTTIRIFINRLDNDVTNIPASYKILLINPFNTSQQQELTISSDVFANDTVINIEETLISPPFPAGSYVEITNQSVLSKLIIAENSILASVQSTSIGVTTQNSLGLVTSIQVVLNTRVQAGDDLFLTNVTNGDKRAFTVGQTAGPGLVTLQLDQATVFDAPAGSYIIGSNAQYEAFLQVTPAGVLAKAEAVTTQNSFAILSAPLPSGIATTTIPVTSVRTLRLLDTSQIGVQDKAGNTEFFQVDGQQDLSPATTVITVVSKAPSVTVGSGAGVFQPMWNQTAILSVQAGEIATRVTSSEVQTLIDQNIDGLLPALSLPFENSAEGFTGTNATLTPDATYLEYLATGSTPFMQRTTSYSASDNPIVTIRVQRVAGTNWGGAFGWSTDGTNFFTQNFIEPAGIDLDFQFTTLDLTSNTNYTGTIVAIRIYLGEANLDEFYIDTLSVGKFNPQTEILADLSSRLTVAEAGLTNTANEFTTYTQNGVLLNGSAKVNEIRNATTMYDTVIITDTRGGFSVRNNQDYYLVNTDGTFQAVKIRDDQTIANVTSPTNVTLKIQSVTFATTIQVGAVLYESAFTQSTRISQTQGTIVLQATENAPGSGEIGTLALIRLDGTGPSSTVTIQGDLVAINNIEIIRGSGSDNGLIRSQGFISGSTGWRIFGDGTAEFNDVIARGSFTVTGGNASTLPPVDDAFLNNNNSWVSSNATLTTGADFSTLQVTSGSLTPAIFKTVSIDTSVNKFVYLEIQREVGTAWGAQLFWQVGGIGYSVNIPEPDNVDSEFASIVVDLRAEANWSGTATALLLVFGIQDIGNRYRIRTIRVQRSDPSLIQLANLQGAEYNTAVSAYLTQRVIRSATKPSVSDRPAVGALVAGALLAGDVWIDTSDGDAPHTYDGTTPYNANGWIRAYTRIDGGSIVTGTVDTNRLNVSNIITVGGIATETYADTVGSNTLVAARANLNVTIRANTAPTVRPDTTALVAGDIWINTASGQGNLPNSWNGSAWIRMYTVIDGGNITTGTIRADLVTIQNTDASPSLTIDNNGINLVYQSYLTDLGSGLKWYDGATLKGVIWNDASEGDNTLNYFVTNSDGRHLFGAGTSDPDERFEINANFVRTGSAQGLRVFGDFQARGDLRIYDSDKSHYYNIVGGDLAGNIQLNLPVLTGARTFAFIDQSQTFSADQTFGHDRLKVRNTNNNGSATLRYGTNNASRTYTFSGASGDIITTGNWGGTNAIWRTVNADQSAFVADGRIQITDGTDTIWIPYMNN